jgi:V8-like Glu-specific endopeptidase
MAAALSAVVVAVGVLGVPHFAAARPSTRSSLAMATHARHAPRAPRFASRATPHLSATPTPSVREEYPDEPLLPTTVSNPLIARQVAPQAAIGALFFTTASGALSSHFCTGTVVSSPTKDLVLTAAHCVYGSGYGGYAKGVVFVPGYEDGNAPYGIWLPSKIMVDSNWTTSTDPDDDVAFLRVHRGTDTDLQDLTGADRLAVDPAYRTLVRVIGYPGDSDAPVLCDNYTSEQSATQLRWACAGYPTGTSGSPFLSQIDSSTGIGEVTGVIGGYETGGDSSNVSYSSYFGSRVNSLYQQAIS